MAEPGEKGWPAGGVAQGRTALRLLGFVQCARPPTGSPCRVPVPSRRHLAFPGFLPWSELTHFGRGVSTGSAGGPGVGRCFSELHPSWPPHSLPGGQVSIRETGLCCRRVWHPLGAPAPRACLVHCGSGVVWPRAGVSYHLRL